MEAAGAQPVVSMNAWKGLGAEMADFARRLRLPAHAGVADPRRLPRREPSAAKCCCATTAARCSTTRSTTTSGTACAARISRWPSASSRPAPTSVQPACSDASAYRSWPEARAGIAALRLRSPNVFLNSTHPLGGCAMGADPRTSVVDASRPSPSGVEPRRHRRLGPPDQPRRQPEPVDLRAGGAQRDGSGAAYPIVDVPERP